jgi:carbon starvation protein CstA
MARCLKKESHGIKAFYGAMIAEGIVAIIWATAAMNFFGNVNGLADAMTPTTHNPAWVVNEISQTWLGKVGGILAIIGVIACPITTGDTAFRSARLTIADIFKYKQGKLSNRLMVSIPLFIGGFIMSQLEFATIWKYLGLSNQILALMVLWTAAMYLGVRNKNHYIISVPATFLTAVCITYLLVAPLKNGGLSLSTDIGYPLGIIIAVLAFIWFMFSVKRKLKTHKSALK